MIQRQLQLLVRNQLKKIELILRESTKKAKVVAVVILTEIQKAIIWSPHIREEKLNKRVIFIVLPQILIPLQKNLFHLGIMRYCKKERNSQHGKPNKKLLN